MVPVFCVLAEHLRCPHQMKAKITEEIARRLETIRSMGVETVMKTIFWVRQRFA